MGLKKILGRFRSKASQKISSLDKRYKYEPLKEAGEIRVLEICKTAGDILECTFSEVRHLELSEYQALSYEWGPPVTPHKVYIRDAQGNSLGYLKITVNLFHALKDLRDANGLPSKRFWIDQICINQNDDIEKALQVSLMASIYIHASQAVTYLGPHSEDIEQELDALHLLDKLKTHFEPNYPRLAELAVTSMLGFKSMYPVQSLPDDVSEDDPIWNLVMKIVDGGWMHRLWMVQENILCAHTVMLRGRRVLDWFSVAAVPLLCNLSIIPLSLNDFRERKSLATVLLSPDTRASWVVRYRQATGQSEYAITSDLRYNLSNYCFRRCDDPRDRIYGVLGISTDAEELGIVPDYRQPVRDLYIDVSVRIYKKDLNLLQHISAMDNQSDTSIPSWVYRAGPTIEGYFGVRSGSSAHPDYLPNARFESNNTVMILRGRIIDGVHLAPTAQSQPGFSNIHQLPLDPAWANYYLTRLCNLIIVLDCVGITLETAASVFRALNEFHEPVSDENQLDTAYALWLYFAGPSIWLTEFFEMYPDAEQETKLQSIIAAFAPLGKQLKEEGKVAEEHLSDVVFSEIRPDFNEAWGQVNIEKLSLGVSEQKRICNMTGKARVGDVIAIFAGCQYPSVLRRVGKENKYRFIGHTCMPGVMEGELYDYVYPEDVDYDIHLV